MTPPAEDTVRWVDERLGAGNMARRALRYVFPEHWSFLLGEVALYAFVFLVLSGTYLAFFFSPDIHSRSIAKVLPNAKLIVLKDVGHMPHHVASDVVVAAIDELAANGGATQATAQRR